MAAGEDTVAAGQDEEPAGPLAFADWYPAGRRRVLAALLVFAEDRDAAHEAADEACARALERWPRVAELREPTAWVCRVAINVEKRRHRRRALERRLLGRVRPAAYVEVAELHPELWAALRALPERQRQAIALRYLADLTERQVADAMGIAPGTVAATLSTARGRLRARLGTDPLGEEEP